MKKTDKKRISLAYGNGVAVLPASVSDYVDKAKKFDIKVLLLIASHDKYREGNCLKALSLALDCEEKDIENAISFWRGTGILSVEGDEQASKKTEKNSKAEKSVRAEGSDKIEVPKRAKASELPQYTTTELNALLERNQHVVELIDECQNILGKMFTASDIKVLMGLVDYLGLDPEYILVIMHYCAKKEIKSMRYVEKMAVSCLDEGYTEAAVLQEALLAREEKNEVVNKIKGIFGIGTRKLTSKEQKQVDNWITNFKYGIDVIEKAYEITVGATGKASVHYANAILEKWYSLEIKDIQGVEELLAKREEEKATDGSSFDLDDFFDAALKRSYSDK